MGWNHDSDAQWDVSTHDQTANPDIHAVTPSSYRIDPDVEKGDRKSLKRRNEKLRALESPNKNLRDQYSVLAGEMDPYLLRHMRFSEDLTCSFGPFAYRAMAGAYEKGSEHIPVQFLISKGLPIASKSQDSAILELEKLVPFETGSRLVGL
jgi:hypothetical protein